LAQPALSCQDEAEQLRQAGHCPHRLHERLDHDQLVGLLNGICGLCAMDGHVPSSLSSLSPGFPAPRATHIRDSVEDERRDEQLAKEIAARTVNKERARAGESEQASSSSLRDISSSRRGGLRSHAGPGGRTRDQLDGEARRRKIRGRSKMNKAQLEQALRRR
jgi:hypothetical protein